MYDDPSGLNPLSCSSGACVGLLHLMKNIAESPKNTFFQNMLLIKLPYSKPFHSKNVEYKPRVVFDVTYLYFSSY
jgi:hypothetical protein